MASAYRGRRNGLGGLGKKSARLKKGTSLTFFNSLVALKNEMRIKLDQD